MNNLSHLITRKRLLTTVTLLGLLSSAAATAATFTTTAPVIGHPPTLTGGGMVTINDKNGNKVPDVGDILTVDEAQFTFVDPDGDNSTATTYEWVSGSAVLGTGKTYTLAAGDLGKTIKLRATAHTDPTLTEPAVAISAVESKFTQLDGTKTDSLIVVSASDVISVSITGGAAPEVGKVLTAVPECAGGTCKSAELEYVWSVESSKDTYTPITGAISETYTPTKDTQKKHIKVAVNTKNAVHPVARR